MKTSDKLLVVLGVLLALNFAAFVVGLPTSNPNPTWEPVTQILSWKQDGVDYSIDFRLGTMTDGKETFRLSERDRKQNGQVLQDLGKYCRESVVWFQGGGIYKNETVVLELLSL